MVLSVRNWLTVISATSMLSHGRKQSIFPLILLKVVCKVQNYNKKMRIREEVVLFIVFSWKREGF